ncbi:sigma-70 family RNA polymerase sigma factor [Blastopirellula sp. JC732]|uniref:Sigma-70 family RNA polymerase sigma factor n=1 Tax=Blastopirellula sediminis TaxID=2894196 RepID=A0A9X1MIN0_9BACT|nr:sigma-70 family RNA polymerase sigma factor [Blastopirellula sediminis]MCC9607936.1 sigma-70 family RNA polymerase sigma factor [Blastopirellula sediminis]MCC9627271.1 sigma-70 family RNA polymerase sigma factor [Blastopirellula sediminis]
MSPTDQTLTDEDFIRLLTVYHGRILQYVTSLIPNRAQAEDVMQEVSLALWEKRTQFDADLNFLTWSRAFARLQVLAHYRKQSRIPTQLSDGALDRVVAAIDTRQHAVDDQLTLLRSCLGKLPDAQRDLVRRFYDGRLDVLQVAQDLHVQPNTLYVKIHRIRERLLACVQKHSALSGAPA